VDQVSFEPEVDSSNVYPSHVSMFITGYATFPETVKWKTKTARVGIFHIKRVTVSK